MTAPRWFAGLPHVHDPQPRPRAVLETIIGDLAQGAAGGGFVLRVAREACRGCIHPPHLGTCTARSGGTAYACGCHAQTPERHWPKDDVRMVAEQFGYRVARIEHDGHGVEEYVMEMDWRNA